MIDERWQKWIKKEDKAVKEGKDETKEVEKQGDATVEVAGWRSRGGREGRAV